MSRSAPMSVLFACNLNSIRSPMAEGLARKQLGAGVRVASCGVWEGGYLDHFMVSVMDEVSVSMGGHQPRTFDDFDLQEFELIVALTPESAKRAEELAAAAGESVTVEHWPLPDPSSNGETRDARMAAYRETRDDLAKRIAERFGD